MVRKCARMPAEVKYRNSQVSAFECIGYEICAGGQLEEGYDKVALYVDQQGFWTHAAKQEGDSIWSSKIGEYEDIRHPTP
jgi:hypothetical protein